MVGMTKGRMLFKLTAFRWDVILLFFVFIESTRRASRLLKTRLLSLASQ